MNTAGKKISNLRINAVFLSMALFWSVIIVALAGWNYWESYRSTIATARSSAYESYIKDVVYLNIPAYMTRQVHELGKKEYGKVGHLTSLKPIRSENAPDDWERKALQDFERGHKEVSSLEPLGNTTYFRFMRPLITETGCLACHAGQGYKVGDPLGGISVSLSWEPYRKGLWAQLLAIILTYGGIWVLGILGLLFVWKQFQNHLSERRRAEEEIRLLNADLERRVQERTAALWESEEKYRMLLDGSIHGILAVDLETGRFIYANPSICRLLRYSTTEFMALGIEDIHPKDSLDHVKTAFELQRRGEKALSELPCLRKDGTVFYADITAAATTINGRECLVGFFEEITERKEIEAGLEKTRKELAVIKIAADEVSEYAESLINTIREPLIALDQDLRVVTASRSFYDFFTVKPEDTVGQLIYDLGNKQWDIPKLRELLETILPEKTTFDNYEVEHDFATIGRRVMLLNARQIQRVLGKERIILLAIEDITERKQVEEKIRVLNVELQDRLQELTEVKALEEKANRGKTEFLSNISHELTTPLNSIIGFSQVLLEKNFGDINEKQRGYLENIFHSGERLHDTLKNIVSFVSIDVTNPDMDWEDLRLKDIATSSLSVFRKAAADRHLTITLDMAKEADRTIRADRGKLIQVFHNLLSNAVKFSREGGQIAINVRNRKGSEESGKDNFIEIMVEDTGIGIKEEDLPRLFRPFEQLEASLTKQFAGVGMGLVLARKLIEAHGGAIRVESDYGKGTKVIFTISVKDRHEK